MNIGKYVPISAKGVFHLPDYISNKKAIINIQNTDMFCFKWCVLAHLHPVVQNRECVSNYKKYENDLNFKGITFPMSVLDIPKFEKLNNISVTVICFEGSDKKGSFGIAYRSQSKRENHVNLLLLSNDTSGHYCLITSMSRLLKSYKNNHHDKYYFCDICFNSFTKQSFFR